MSKVGDGAIELETISSTPDPSASEDVIDATRRYSAVMRHPKIRQSGYLEWRDQYMREHHSVMLHVPLFSKYITMNFWKVDTLELIILAIVIAICMASSTDGIGSAICLLCSLLLVPHNSVLTYIVGTSFERAVSYHRWIGYFGIIPMVVHADAQGLFDGVALDFQQTTGAAAAGLYIILVVFALAVVRRKAWDFFKLVHITMVTAFIIIAIIHATATAAIAGVALVLYAYDVAVRFQRSKTTAILENVEKYPSCGVVKLTVKTHNAQAYSAGQYAFINLPSVGSAFSIVQWHPFSVISAPRSNTVSFAIKAMGNWTNRAVDQLKTGDKIHVDGPYGLHSIPFQRYETIVIVAGGIGVTPMMSLCKDILQTVKDGVPYHEVKNVHFHWTAADLTYFLIFEDVIREMLQYSEPGGIVTFHVHLHSSKGALPDGQPWTGPAFVRERLNVDNIFKELAGPGAKKRGFCDQTNGTPCAVLACGPKELMVQVELICVSYSNADISFHFHSEEFLL